MAADENLSIDSSRMTAHEILEEAAENARRELSRPSRALAFSGLAGGLTMGLTPLAVAAIQTSLPPSPSSALISYLFYPIGFIAVIIGRAQLFTENTLYPVVLVLSDRQHFRNMLRLWGIVFAANVGGAFLFALLAMRTSALEPAVKDELARLGMNMVSVPAGGVFWSAVIGGWLIALVAWMVSASQWTIGQVVMTWLLTFLVGIGQFAHCIASSGEIIAAVIRGPAPLGSYFHWLLFAATGNIVGGVTIVSLLNWGQVHAGERDAQENVRKEIVPGGVAEAR
jgi:formate-nitrite transporter family protein